MSKIHVKVCKQMLQRNTNPHLGYEKGSQSGINIGNSRNGSYSKKNLSKHREAVIEVSRERVDDLNM